MLIAISGNAVRAVLAKRDDPSPSVGAISLVTTYVNPSMPRFSQ